MQPKLPQDIGFYDLSQKENIKKRRKSYKLKIKFTKEQLNFLQNYLEMIKMF